MCTSAIVGMENEEELSGLWDQVSSDLPDVSELQELVKNQTLNLSGLSELQEAIENQKNKQANLDRLSQESAKVDAELKQIKKAYQAFGEDFRNLQEEMRAIQGRTSNQQCIDCFCSTVKAKLENVLRTDLVMQQRLDELNRQVDQRKNYLQICLSGK